MVDLNPKLNELVIRTFSSVLEKKLPSLTVLDKITRTQFSTVNQIGDEVDLIMPGNVTVFDYTGGDLPNPEYPDTTSIKLKVDLGAAVHFAFDAVKKEQLNATGNNASLAAALISEYTDDAHTQIASKLETARAAQYVKASYVINGGNSSTPKAYTSATIHQLFADMRSQYKVGYIDAAGVNRIPWEEGKMSAFIHPDIEKYIVDSPKFVYNPDTMDLMKTGKIGQLMGWKLYATPYINTATISDKTAYYPIFGVDGKSLGSIIQKNLTLQSYIPQLRLDTAYKGFTLFGVGVARSDTLGSALITAAYS